MRKRFQGILMIVVFIALGVTAFAGERTEYRSGGNNTSKTEATRSKIRAK